MRKEHTEKVQGFEEEIARHVMDTEEVRMIAHIHYEKIIVLEEEIDTLKLDLREMTEKRDVLDKMLKAKEAEYDDLFEKFEKKSMEFINERHAHRLQIEANQRLEEEIKDLKRQIADLLQQIEDLNAKIAELEEKNAEGLQREEELSTRISVLEEKLENKKERWDVQIQTFLKTKNRHIQTDPIAIGATDQKGGISSFGHVSDSAEHFIDHQTVVSTNMNSTT